MFNKRTTLFVEQMEYQTERVSMLTEGESGNRNLKKKKETDFH